MMRRRTVLGPIAAATVAGLVVCGCSDDDRTGEQASATPSVTASVMPNQAAGVDIPADRIGNAVDRLGGLAEELMASSKIPGMAVAVVHDGRVIYSDGFGVGNVDSKTEVGPDTVFQLASVSKSVGATVVAQQVTAGNVEWDTPIDQLMPSFALSDPYVTDHVTVGDLYAHRSGLPDHAGDLLEDLGYDRAQVLERLGLLPLGPFRDSYEYTNFGLTAAAEAVAQRSGTDWETLSQQALYAPLGMNATSSRYSDFADRTDRADGHVLVDGEYRVSNPARQPDAQSPAGGVSSSVTDMAKWMTMVLADGTADGRTVVAPNDLLPAISPQSVSSPPQAPDARAGFYGFGFNVSESSAGRVVLSHSGGFELGAATAFTLIPSADVGIVTLTNSAPIGVPETLNAEFADLVQFGEIRQDWYALYQQAISPMGAPIGELAGATPPADPAPAGSLPSYAGVYANAYYGPATVSEMGGALTLTLGPEDMDFPLTHWDGDTFIFTPPGENATPGTVSKATFDDNRLVLEYYDKEGLGTFDRES
ncbi:serine hydrolase [Nocardia cyriacigeorgica]|uniref:serine hydrolase n=1 Tax=Nocardia cyriacigeorgica TaxID=135487 RepID=UPI0013B8DED4|nr:serine hydrolase [Nocardia cyriacigeorgica]NEW48878.1 serine hydrolase [Nocardia cyriacigeorgica]